LEYYENFTAEYGMQNVLLLKANWLPSWTTKQNHKKKICEKEIKRAGLTLRLQRQSRRNQQSTGKDV